MPVSEETRRRVVVALVVALVFLVARIGASRLGASASVEQGLYGLAVLSLVAAVVLVARHRINDF